MLDKLQVMRLMIPFAGKMFKSSLNKGNKALCFCINKGYIESDELAPLYYLGEQIGNIEPRWLYKVGGIDKIHIGSKHFVYRQRIFFTDFYKLCELCKSNGIVILTTKDFKIGINNIVSCGNELKYLEWYAGSFSETVDTYLTNTCKVQIYNFLTSRLMLTPLRLEVDKILMGKEGYLDRAPFLAKDYNLSLNTTSVFVPNKSIVSDKMYKTKDLSLTDDYGFSMRVIEKDSKKGVFKHEG